MAGKGPVDVDRDVRELSNLIDNSKNLNFDSGDKLDGKISITRNIELNLDRFIYVLNQYQEQPCLIDKFTNKFINDLLNLIKNQNSNKFDLYKNLLYKFLYYLTKLRGSKRTLKFLPHQVDDLYWAVKELENVKNDDFWEKSYALLLCLSVTALIPFHMSRFDMEPVEGRMIMVEKIIQIGKIHLFKLQGIVQDGAAQMLGRLFSRSDVCEIYLKEFMEYSFNVLENYHSDKTLVSGNKTTGILKVLNILLKQSKRTEFLAIKEKIDLDFDFLMEFINKIINDDSIDVGIKVRLQCTKLAQRIALLHLPQKVVTWRYNRGKRTLNQLENENSTKTENIQKSQPDNFEINDIIPEVIDILLKSLTDMDTIVRWSSAKGLGRITARLPLEFAEQILPAILTEAENAKQAIHVAPAYHGICLCLAELGRRGLIAEDELQSVIDFVLNIALQYDVKTSTTHSVGRNVRDAACYVCWSFARAYTPTVLKPFINKMAAGLLIIATTDKEVNCRRAASAAFQEHVGRQGQFPNGIEMVTKVDFSSVSLLSKSVKELAPWVVEINSEIYKKYFLDHLINYKLNHWSEQLREFSAECFSKIFQIGDSVDVEYLEQLILNANSIKATDLSYQHGSILTLANLCQSNALNEQNLQEIIKIPEIVSSSPRWKGIAGELLRPVVFKLCKGILTNYNSILSQNLKTSWAKIGFETILYSRWVSDKNRDKLNIEAVDLMHKLGDKFILMDEQSDQFSISLIQKYWNFENEGVRAGLALLLSKIEIFQNENLTNVEKSLKMEAVNLLKFRILKTCSVDVDWTISRRDAIRSLSKIAGRDEICIECLIYGCNDNTISKQKGDIGFYVRKASLESIVDNNIQDPRLIPSAVRELGSKLVQVRESAIKALMLLSNCPNLPWNCEILPYTKSTIANDRLISKFSESWSAKYSCNQKVDESDEDYKIRFEKGEKEHANYVNTCNKKLMKYLQNDNIKTEVLPLEELCMNILGEHFSKYYPEHVLIALMVASGDLTLSLSKSANSALKLIKWDTEFHGTLLLKILNENDNDRIVVSSLKALETLFNEGIHLFYKPLITKIKSFCLNKSKNVGRIMAGIKCLAAVVSYCDDFEIIDMVMKKCSLLLVHKFPRIRQFVADILNETLLICETEISCHYPNFDYEVISELLDSTEWDAVGKSTELKLIKGQILNMFEN